MYRKSIFPLFFFVHENLKESPAKVGCFRIFGRNMNFIGYLRLLSKHFFGLGYLMRKAATASTPTMDIVNTGNKWKLITATTLKTMTLEFEMVNFAIKVIQKKSCSYGSYRWIIMLEKFGPPDLNVCCLAGSSKPAPRILFFKLPWLPNLHFSWYPVFFYKFFTYKTIENHFLTFFSPNISASACVSWNHKI